MKFTSKTPLDIILNGLFAPYALRVPDVNIITSGMITKGLIKSQKDIVNDHIAFRTLGVSNLGIRSLERVFLHHGYSKQDRYFFEQKKLDAYWYKPPSEDYPRVFISELKVDELSRETANMIKKYTKNISFDPLDGVDLDNPNALVDFLHHPLWELPTWQDYKSVLSNSEYGAWVLYNRYYLNHYTISVHALPYPYNELEKFNAFLKTMGIRLNNAGGEIKTSVDGLLRQSSTVSQMVTSTFADGEKHKIAGSYVEFAARAVLPEFMHLANKKLSAAHRRDGFEVNNANKIFESTFQKQTKRKD